MSLAVLSATLCLDLASRLLTLCGTDKSHCHGEPLLSTFQEEDWPKDILDYEDIFYYNEDPTLDPEEQFKKSFQHLYGQLQEIYRLSYNDTPESTSDPGLQPSFNNDSITLFLRIDDAELLRETLKQGFTNITEDDFDEFNFPEEAHEWMNEDLDRAYDIGPEDMDTGESNLHPVIYTGTEHIKDVSFTQRAERGDARSRLLELIQNGNAGYITEDVQEPEPDPEDDELFMDPSGPVKRPKQNRRPPNKQRHHFPKPLRTSQQRRFRPALKKGPPQETRKFEKPPSRPQNKAKIPDAPKLTTTTPSEPVTVFQPTPASTMKVQTTSKTTTTTTPYHPLLPHMFKMKRPRVDKAPPEVPETEKPGSNKPGDEKESGTNSQFYSTLKDIIRNRLIKRARTNLGKSTTVTQSTVSSSTTTTAETTEVYTYTKATNRPKKQFPPLRRRPQSARGTNRRMEGSASYDHRRVFRKLFGPPPKARFPMKRMPYVGVRRSMRKALMQYKKSAKRHGKRYRPYRYRPNRRYSGSIYSMMPALLGVGSLLGFGLGSLYIDGETNNFTFNPVITYQGDNQTISLFDQTTMNNNVRQTNSNRVTNTVTNTSNNNNSNTVVPIIINADGIIDIGPITGNGRRKRRLKRAFGQRRHKLLDILRDKIDRGRLPARKLIEALRKVFMRRGDEEGSSTI